MSVQKLTPFRCLFLALFLLAIEKADAQFSWKTLANSPQNGQKQDDLFFLDPSLGFSVNGSGRIFKTADGGATFSKIADQPGTYFRCIAFLDSLRGFAGNIGTDYFPNVTDTNPLYRTLDGGQSWSVVSEIDGEKPSGLCALQVVSPQVLYAGGRVGGPTHLLKSIDGGQNWTSQSLDAQLKMVTDLWFKSPDTGFVFGATNTNVQFAKAKIIRTTDGGATWQTVFVGSRTFELCWKAAFPTAATGFATLLSYAPNTTARFVAKTTDGGATWAELPFTDNGNKAFGIGFLDETTGWVGCDNSIYQTVDGGATWQPKNVGQYVNKIRVLRPAADQVVAYGIGLRAYKMEQTLSATEAAAAQNELRVFPNPAFDSLIFEYFLEEKAAVALEISDSAGRILKRENLGQRPPGPQREFVGVGFLPEGIYFARLLAGEKTAVQTILKSGQRP